MEIKLNFEQRHRANEMLQRLAGADLEEFVFEFVATRDAYNKIRRLAFARHETYAAANPLGGPATMFEAIARRLRAGEDYQAVMDDYGIRFEAPAVEQNTPKPITTSYCGQILPPIGTLLKIRWCDPNHDWPYFFLVLVDPERERIRLKGADYPDGSAEHDGDVFWAQINEIDSIEAVNHDTRST